MKAIILPNDNKSALETLEGAMAQIGGIPVIFHIIKMLESAGVSKIIICDSSGTSDIEELLDESYERLNGVQIEHFKVSSNLKSGEILEKCRKYDLENTFFVVPNDVITDLDLKKALDFHRKNARVATVCVAECKKYFVALGSDTACESKIVNSGIYVFEEEILDYAEKRKCIDGEILLRVAEDDELAIYNDGSFIQRCNPSNVKMENL